MNPKNKNKKTSLRDRIGGAVEKAGHKIAEKGAPKLGQKVHDLGDKIEKSHSNPNHPHKV
ncbi:MAG TPA: hypothetical protein VM901_11200 [Bdellovibrionota bacterium]|jgi:hypothetical protein|nr:hypothetical protein [Bdellovibrionota bacterium]